MLELKDVLVRQGDFQLGPLNLVVRKGEYFVILGESGSGKSTLFETIAGFKKVLSGEILLDGQDITHVPPEKRNIGIMFQESALFPHMSIRENLEYGLKKRGVPREEIKKLINIYTEKHGMVDLLQRYPANLSGGEKQRFDLLRTLITNPKLVLLDEPFSSLDPLNKKSFRTEVKKSCKESNIPFLHITHDQMDAFILADKMAVLKDGKIIASGNPIDLFSNPKNKYLAEFFGFDNIYEARIIDSRDGLTFLDVNGVTLKIPQLSSSPKTIKIGFRSDEVVISRQPISKSTLRNCLRGKIKDFVHEGELIKTRISVENKMDVVALITRNALFELNLKLEEDVYLSIKASSIKIFN